MRRLELSGSEASELKLKRRTRRPYISQKTFFMEHILWKSGQEGSCGPGSVEPGPALPIAASSTSHRPGRWWAEEEGWQEDQNSWIKAEFERKETQQDGRTAVEYSCLHCQRTLTGLNATQLKNDLLNPGGCKFLYSTFVQEVAKQVAEVMTAPGVCSVAGDMSMQSGVLKSQMQSGCSSAHRCGADGSG